jgi:hypothetical protein
MPGLIGVVEYVAKHQAEFEAGEEIYGSFSEKLERIQRLYTENRDRYRRYP